MIKTWLRVCAVGGGGGVRRWESETREKERESAWAKLDGAELKETKIGSTNRSGWQKGGKRQLGKTCARFYIW